MRKLAFPITTLRQQLPPFGSGLLSLRRQPPGSDAAVVCMCVCMSVCMCVCVITCTHQQLRPLRAAVHHFLRGRPCTISVASPLARAAAPTQRVKRVKRVKSVLPIPCRPLRLMCVRARRRSTARLAAAVTTPPAKVSLLEPATFLLATHRLTHREHLPLTAGVW
jgi:hypothetical protein